MFEGFAARRVAVEGVEIAYVIGGSGPPVLLLHGFPQCKAMWAQVAPRLAEQFTVVCADLRGYGDSDKPEAVGAAYSFRSMAADQVGLMRQLGFGQFHLVGHDRGARTAHRLARDHADAVRTLTLMDIAPTRAMYEATDRHLAKAYWHWFFLAQPAPFPERVIAQDPDYFFETCLVGWGAARLEGFDPEMLGAYRTAWRNPATIHAFCGDYRASAGIDLEHDASDAEHRLTCPCLVVMGARGVVARLFDVVSEWQACCADVRVEHLDAGHFLVDEAPEAVSGLLEDFLVGR